MAEPRIAVVVPTLDEEPALRQNLAAVVADADEVVVSDGGSRDETVAVARRLGADVVEGAPGRGAQLNRGARATGGEVLVFLHADTRLPANGLDEVRRALAAGYRAGAFFIRFDIDRQALRFGARLINLRTRATGVPLGDQAQWVERALFEELGGYREWPILEDLDFARRLKRRTRLALLEPPAVTAARRFVTNGIARTICTNWLIWTLYLAGVSPERLARLYRKIR